VWIAFSYSVLPQKARMISTGEPSLLSGSSRMTSGFSKSRTPPSAYFARRLSRGAVGKKQDALFQATLPKPVDDLERGVGFSGAGCHDEQMPVVAFLPGNRLDGAIDGDLLVVARCAGRTVGEIILRDHRLGLIGDAFVGFVFAPELLGGRELVEGEFRFDGAGLRGFVMEQKTIAVAAEDERHIQRSGIAEGLLHSRADRVVVVLGLYDRERNVGLVVKDVIHPLLGSTGMNFSTHIDATIGEAHFLANLSLQIPSSRHKAGGDKFRADIAFAERFFIHATRLKNSRPDSVPSFSSYMHLFGFQIWRFSHAKKQVWWISFE
jgi:hypothetical protein